MQATTSCSLVRPGLNLSVDVELVEAYPKQEVVEERIAEVIAAIRFISDPSPDKISTYRELPEAESAEELLQVFLADSPRFQHWYKCSEQVREKVKKFTEKVTILFEQLQSLKNGMHEEALEKLERNFEVQLVNMFVTDRAWYEKGVTEDIKNPSDFYARLPQLQYVVESLYPFARLLNKAASNPEKKEKTLEKIQGIIQRLQQEDPMRAQIFSEAASNFGFPLGV